MVIEVYGTQESQWFWRLSLQYHGSVWSIEWKVNDFLLFHVFFVNPVFLYKYFCFGGMHYRRWENISRSPQSDAFVLEFSHYSLGKWIIKIVTEKSSKGRFDSDEISPSSKRDSNYSDCMKNEKKRCAVALSFSLSSHQMGKQCKKTYATVAHTQNKIVDNNQTIGTKELCARITASPFPRDFNAIAVVLQRFDLKLRKWPEVFREIRQKNIIWNFSQKQGSRA